MKPVVPPAATVSLTPAAAEPKSVAVVEIDTVFQAVGAYRVLQNGLLEPGSQNYEALVQQANRVVGEALERVRIREGFAHIMVAPLMSEHQGDAASPDVTEQVVAEVAVVEELAWQRRRSTRRQRRTA